MSLSTTSSDHFFKTACYFEAFFVVTAVVLGWMTDINPFADVYFSETVVFYGLIGTLPLILLYFITEKMPFNSFKEIKKILLETMGGSLQKYHWTDLLVLATITGISEEVLFRGVLQPWLEQSLGMGIGLIVSSLVFGLLHAITPLYGLLATLISYYLGWSLDIGESRNLFTPIIIHTFYDFFAFMALVHSLSKKTHD
ncbi:MAG: CPBP family intramembrane metalloprotease [Methylococcales bacterium]|nr:CPBP family intramembrane metalloprotease [Methylococcales bacterium]MCK5925191.1 CPBP family intramembrane metalloprotease [Methylococcales bacterium]